MKIARQYADMLAVKTEGIDEKIAEFEQKGLFNEHLDSILTDDIILPDASYEYIPSFKTKIKFFFDRLFVINEFISYTNDKLFRTEVRGKHNLEGLNGAMVICNHVNKLDCIAVMRALKGKESYYVGAQFNNMKTFLGDMMRAGGMLPLTSDFGGMKAFNKAIEYYLNKGAYITFYPEQSEWWGYKKVRPYKDGAFHYAVTHKKPVLPVFITYGETDERTGIPKFIVNILRPVYPDENLMKKEAIHKLKTESRKECIDCYERFYGVEHRL